MSPAPRISRDVYANLLRDTRGLRRDQSGARDAWYAALPWERKEETLFELEMLLKGFACFGNPRNHAGPPRRVPNVAHDFREELRIVRDALAQTVDQVRQLLGEQDRAYAFSQYLESVMPEDSERSRLIRDQLTQDTPQESLFVLRNAFSAFLETAEGLLRVGRVSHRLYYAALGTITREVGRNTYFNPLITLEFRTEFDRIRNPQVLDALHGVNNESGHRVAALTLLTLFRSLRYVQLIDEYAARPETARRAYLILSVFRSDMRALMRFLGRRACDVMADGFERELLGIPAAELRDRYAELGRTASSLVSLRGTLESIANTARIEVRRSFERELPAPEAATSGAELGPQLVVAAASLRATVHHAIGVICAELAPRKGVPALASDEISRRAASNRLRRDVWMFTQILRAFLAKAKATPGDSDRWASYASFHFVREFLEHFRAIGYQLVRLADYEHLDRFMAALDSLRDADLLEAHTMEAAVSECEGFYTYLEELFQAVSQRSELQAVAFDKREAAETLKIYLGAA